MNKNIKKENSQQDGCMPKYSETVLQKYYKRGYLELPQSKFSAEDRKTAGEMLAYDFYRGQYKNIQALQIYADHIPTTGNKTLDLAMCYRDRYLQAVKSIPREFWPAVRRVCIEDKMLKSEEEISTSRLKNKNSIYFQKMLLNMGLERLVEYYLKKNKKSS